MNGRQKGEMIMRKTHSLAAATVAALVACGSLTSGALAQGRSQPPGQPLAPVVAVAPVPPVGKMEGKITIHGREIAYVGETGETVLTNAAGQPRATISSTAYMAKGKDAKTRPVAFLYNGGPGSATIALREGIAPKHIEAGKARGEWVFADNPESLIDVTDLVFVDAPGLGYGRFYSEDAKAEYWGVEQDAAAFAQFVDKWLKSHGRTASPRFLVGESYGGVRSGFLAENLARMGLKVDRVALVSPSTSAGGANPLGARDRAVLALPTQAAVARFHHKGAYGILGVEQVAAKAQNFALGPYTEALAKGDALSDAEKDAIAKQVSDFSGVPVELILANRLRVTNFGDTLLPGERLGRDDGRLHAPVEEMKKLPVPYDEPGSTLYTLTYDQGKALDAMFADLFGYRSPTPFVRFSAEASGAWGKNKVTRGPTSIPLMFKDQMAADPKLRIFMLGGYYDTTVPYVQAQSDYHAADLPKGRFDYRTFHAGHAVFSDPVAQKMASDELRAFFTAR
jgi:carboxypeptidase C (cathepsin A)